jgi:hypothetical protein
MQSMRQAQAAGAGADDHDLQLARSPHARLPRD